MKSQQLMCYVKHNITGLLLFLFSTSAYSTCIGLNCTCTISSSTFNLGAYAPLSGSPTSGSMTVSVTCSALIAGLNVSYAISLNTGSSGNFTSRTMTFSANTLNYNLYTDAGHTSIWGDGTSSTATVSDSYNLILLSVTRNYTVYGLIPASQNVPVGSYSDTITATVTY